MFTKQTMETGQQRPLALDFDILRYEDVRMGAREFPSFFSCRWHNCRLDLGGRMSPGAKEAANQIEWAVLLEVRGASR